jgi:hypothetical protein
MSPRKLDLAVWPRLARRRDPGTATITRMTDEALLASGDHARLLARYEVVIVQRCVAAMRARRRRGRCPGRQAAPLARAPGRQHVSRTYRVVVHKVIGWTLKDYWAGRDTAVPLPEGWEPGAEDDLDGRLIVDEASPTCRRASRRCGGAPARGGVEPRPDRRTARDRAQQRRPGRPPRPEEAEGSAGRVNLTAARPPPTSPSGTRFQGAATSLLR